MQYISHYDSPLGGILLAADEAGLNGLWFDERNYFTSHLYPEQGERELPLFVDTKRWLDIYFSGKNPEFSIPLHLTGTAFQLEVWRILLQIPYGRTTTYGTIAHTLAEKRENRQMSAQAVGGAVGHNPVSIIVPCHRVIGARGDMVGYGGGIDKKAALLKLEHALPAAGKFS